MRLVLLALLVPATARAELRLDYEITGGAEAGTIVGKSPPELVGEAGGVVAYRADDAIFGVAVDVLAVARDRAPFDAQRELRSDLMLLIADPEGRGHLTIGAGIRDLSIEKPEAEFATNIHGWDFVHLDVVFRLVKWDVGTIGRVELDARGAFTFGCYSGEMAACTSTISATYVAGLGVAFATAR